MMIPDALWCCVEDLNLQHTKTGGKGSSGPFVGCHRMGTWMGTCPGMSALGFLAPGLASSGWTNIPVAFSKKSVDPFTFACLFSCLSAAGAGQHVHIP